MNKKLREILSIRLAKNPRSVVLFVILLFNVLLLVIAALVISKLSLTGTEQMGFFEAAFYTVTMILDAGCISFVIADIGKSGVAIAIVCLLVIIVGMVTFTGAVIGYITNYISSFVDRANAVSRKLRISNHLVILNWNTRASEIINDLLYCKNRQKVVVLADGRHDEIEREIDERLSDTIHRENRKLYYECRELPFFKRVLTYWRNHMKNNIVVIVKEGDVYSSKQLHDIAIEHARSVVILGNDVSGRLCKYEYQEISDESTKGNEQIIKALMQVADITSAEYSDDDQKIIVEIPDDWTGSLVDQIIDYKRVKGKCNIVPLRINQILGQILSQFCIMPELNLAYNELFSNKGATFQVEERVVEDDVAYIDNYLTGHTKAIPLTSMKSDGRDYFFYSAEDPYDVTLFDVPKKDGYSIALNKWYWIEQKNVIILGHNSKCREIMEGFKAFREEWGYHKLDEEYLDKIGHTKDEEIIQIIVVDDEDNLEKMDHYKDYPFVIDTVAADVSDSSVISKTIDSFMDMNNEDVSVLILSDDNVVSERIDANALSNLVFVQDIITKKKESDPYFDESSIDVIVEIIDPKHHDIVSNYSVKNVVISNRYISKMITQIGEKEAIFDFYMDILTYDKEENDTFMSKEVYAKKVSSFFSEVPKECTEEEFVRAVWSASIDKSIPKEKQNPTLTLGYVKADGSVTLFGSRMMKDRISLSKKDKILVFTNH